MTWKAQGGVWKDQTSLKAAWRAGSAGFGGSEVDARRRVPSQGVQAGPLLD